MLPLARKLEPRGSMSDLAINLLGMVRLRASDTTSKVVHEEAGPRAVLGHYIRVLDMLEWDATED